MEDDNKYDLNDIVQLAVEQKPVEFGDAVSSVLVDRIAAAVETRKQEIAQTMFNRVDADEEHAEEE